MESENLPLELAKTFTEAVAKEGTNKFAEFIGGFLPFLGLTKKAVNTYIHEIEQSDMSPEAKMIAIANTKKTFRELKNQTAIIDVACSAIDIEQDTNLDALPGSSGDLIARLIDAGKFVSDEDLQLLWGNVLAGELEKPGSTPKNTVRILSELSKEHATIFSNLCSLQVDVLIDTGSEIENIGSALMIKERNADYLKQLGIYFMAFQELEDLGLINFSELSSYTRKVPHIDFPYIHLVSETHVMTIHMEKDDFPCGAVLLTGPGNSISRFVPKRYNQSHMDAITAYFKSSGIEVFPSPGILITKAKDKGPYTEYEYKRL